MGVKKDIGKVLSESLKDLKSSPNEKVWERIQGSLNANKKNKRIIPFWVRALGLGLIIIISGSIIYTSLNNENLEIEIIKANTSSPTELNKTQQNTNNNNEGIFNSQSEDNLINQNGNDVASKQDSLNNNSITINKEFCKDNSSNREDVNSRKNIITSNKNTFANNNITVVRNKKTDTPNNTTIKYKIEDNQPTTKNSSSINSDYKNTESNNDNTTNKVASNQINKSKLNNNTNVLDISDSLLDEEKNHKITLKKEYKIIDIDSLIIKDSIQPKIALLDSIRPNKTIEKKKLLEEESYWDVSFYVIPTYYNTLSKGSTFGNNFVDHKKEGGITLSYRVTFDIKLSEKLNLRTGFGKVNLSYKTIGVSTTTSTGTIPNLTEFDGISYDFEALENIYSNELLGTSSSLDFKQKFGYFEIPVELVYKFPSKKIKWKVIGGGSVLKITNNSILAESSSGSYAIGKSNNLSKYSYSVNLGGGFDYPVSKRLKINLEPMFRYHIKTFSREIANFKPYSFSVLLGVTYGF